ncbi:hypothetical protein DFH07DRAFT_784936 [Mycena maculata]|uniref:Uncharacterized protein n=1 Tax=Mycena maculata TaxID=230809 RepID=A0AAD7MHZ0_9AGAR|nr:hypothetical protein DFH07DRAFT_784936 [Mycena maculata]
MIGMAETRALAPPEPSAETRKYKRNLCCREMAQVSGVSIPGACRVNRVLGTSSLSRREAKIIDEDDRWKDGISLFKGEEERALPQRVVESLGHDKNTITSGLEQVLWQATCVVEKGKNEPSFRLHREQKLKGKKIHGSSVMAISASCTLFCTNFEVRAIHHGCPQHGHVEHGLLDKCKTLGWDGTLNSMAIMGTQLWPEPRRLVEVLFRATDSLLEQSNYSPKN